MFRLELFDLNDYAIYIIPSVSLIVFFLMWRVSYLKKCVRNAFIVRDLQLAESIESDRARKRIYDSQIMALSYETGELIHYLGNLLADEQDGFKFGRLTVSDGRLLQGLGCSLRQSDSHPFYCMDNLVDKEVADHVIALSRPERVSYAATMLYEA